MRVVERFQVRQTPAAAPPVGSGAGWLHDDQGASAIEYALIAALIAVAILVGISSTGLNLTVMYERWTSAVIAAIS